MSGQGVTQVNRWVNTGGRTNTHSGDELGRRMFADADTQRWSAFHSFFVRLCLCVFVLFFSPQHQITLTYTDRLTFQSMVAKAVMVGCKTSFCQSVHMKLYITLSCGVFLSVTIHRSLNATTPVKYSDPLLKKKSSHHTIIRKMCFK